MKLTSIKITQALLNNKAIYRLAWQADPNNKIIIYKWATTAPSNGLTREDHYSLSTYYPTLKDLLADDWVIDKQ